MFYWRNEMADISRSITRKSLNAKRKTAIKTIKAQTKEKIKQIKMEYSLDSQKKKDRLLEKEQKKELRAQKANARVSYNARQPRPFTLGEDVFNSICHGIGAGLSVAAIVLLVIKAVMHAPAGLVPQFLASCTVFGILMFAVFLFSTLSHAIYAMTARRIFEIMSHICLVLMIASIMTPFALLSHAENALAACGLIWGICAVVAVIYGVFNKKVIALSSLVLVVIGWFVALYYAAASGGLLVYAMALFTLGGIFYLFRKYKWTHSAFHVFALAGSVVCFFAVYNLV